MLRTIEREEVCVMISEAEATADGMVCELRAAGRDRRRSGARGAVGARVVGDGWAGWGERAARRRRATSGRRRTDSGGCAQLSAANALFLSLCCSWLQCLANYRGTLWDARSKQSNTTGPCRGDHCHCSHQLTQPDTTVRVRGRREDGPSRIRAATPLIMPTRSLSDAPPPSTGSGSRAH